jgi:competence protein ComEA
MPKHATSLQDRIRRLFPSTPELAEVDEPYDLGSAIPPARRRWSRGSARAVVLGLAALVAIVGWWWWQGRPREVTVAPTLVANGQPLAGVASPSAVAQLVVHVVGDVHKPGLVQLPSGARVNDALTAAGGLKPGARLGPVNLAREVVDGEQIVFGKHAAAAVSTTPGLLNLNSATLDDFEALPGIGPVLAQRIVTWRDANGPFTAVEELREVSGIGDSTYADLSPLVRI